MVQELSLLREASLSLGPSSRPDRSSRRRKSWPVYDQDEIDAVAKVLKSSRVNQWTGDLVREFEGKFASFVGAQYAVAFANGSLALEAAWNALPQKRVSIPCRTFVATAWSAYRAGKDVEYVDVNEDGLAVKDVTCTVHLGGKVSEVKCEIEDCAQAMGASYKEGGHVGTRARIGVFSFCQDKILSTGGEGGMCVTSDYMVYRKLWSWKDHGKNFERAHTQTHGAYNWCHTSIGTNARMMEVQAAIGLIQLKKVNPWVVRRRQIAQRLYEGLSDLRTLRMSPVTDHEAGYRFYVYLIPERIRETSQRDWILRMLERRDVPCGAGSCPEVYREQAVYTGNEHCPNAKELGLTSIAFKIDPTMSNAEVNRIITATRGVMKKAARV